MPVPVVTHEGPAEQIDETHLLAIDLVGESPAEAVIRSAQTDDGLSGVEVVGDMRLLLCGQGEQPQEENGQVRFLQMLQAGNAVMLECTLLALLRIHWHGRIHQPLVVDTEQYRAVETVMLRQDSSHHRHRLLTAVFLVGADQHDVLPFAWTRLASVGQPFRTLRHGVRADLARCL